MKISNIALVLASIAPVYSQTYFAKLYVEYLPQDVNGFEYEPVDGQFLHAVKETPDSYFFFLGSEEDAVTVAYDSVEYEAYIQDAEGIYFIGIDPDLNLVATSTVTNEVQFYISNDERNVFYYLQFDNLDYSFVPTKQVGDPLGYSNTSYALVSDQDNDPHGALIHYELLGNNPGHGAGLLNPSSISGSHSTTFAFTTDPNVNTQVVTTNPPTTPVSFATESGSVSQDLSESGVLATGFNLLSETGSASKSSSRAKSSGSGSALTSSGASSSASPSKTSASSQTSSSSSSSSSGASESSSTTAASSASGSASGSASTEAKPSSSGSSAPSSSASSSKGEGSGPLIPHAAGILALVAALI